MSLLLGHSVSVFSYSNNVKVPCCWIFIVAITIVQQVNGEGDAGEGFISKNDDIINGGLLPLNDKDINLSCGDAGVVPDDSLISTRFNSEPTFCPGSRSTPNAVSPKAQALLDEISAQENLYFEQLTAGGNQAGDSQKNNSPGYIQDCSLYLKLIDQDLLPFAAGITSDIIESASTRGILYQIIGGQVYRKSDCNFPNRCSGIEHFIKKVAPDIPDTEFVVNVSDWPQIPSWSSTPLPVFSFSKTSEYNDITYPAWTFWEGGPAISIYPKGIGRWDLVRKSLMSTAKKVPWEKKKSVAFFRGSRTSQERDPLVLLSRKHPEIVDAKYTKNQAWKSDKDTLNAPAAEEVSFEGHCNYKYLFNYRGVAASFRFKHLFLCQSLVFHVGQDWIEFFYPALLPWIHFVPVDKSAKEQDLKFLIEFFQQNEDIAKRIATRGQEFVAKKLQLSHVSCYWRQLLSAYTQLLKYPVRKRVDVVRIS